MRLVRARLTATPIQRPNVEPLPRELLASLGQMALRARVDPRRDIRTFRTMAAARAWEREMLAAREQAGTRP
jgi:hypothetical protein